AAGTSPSSSSSSRRSAPGTGASTTARARRHWRTWWMPATDPPRSSVKSDSTPSSDDPISDQLERWLQGEGAKTVASPIELVEEKSFAILFVLLLGVSALPLPTGGATHVFEIIAVLLAAQLVAGRDVIWLPDRWRRLELAGERQQRFLAGLMRLIRRLER